MQNGAEDVVSQNISPSGIYKFDTINSRICGGPGNVNTDIATNLVGFLLILFPNTHYAFLKFNKFVFTYQALRFVVEYLDDVSAWL